MILLTSVGKLNLLFTDKIPNEPILSQYLGRIQPVENSNIFRFQIKEEGMISEKFLWGEMKIKLRSATHDEFWKIKEI